jgi:hypothetical protein
VTKAKEELYYSREQCTMLKKFSKKVVPPLTAAVPVLASETAPSEPKKRNSAVLAKQDSPEENEKKSDTTRSASPRPSSFQDDSFEGKNNYFDEEEDKKDHPSPGLPAPRNTLIKRPPLLGRVDSQYINYEIPTNEGVDEHVKRYQGHDSWRYKIVKFIHSKKVQYILMSLLLLDVIILFVEMFLLATFPMCNLIERDGLSCCPDPTIASSSSLASPLQHDIILFPLGFFLVLMVSVLMVLLNLPRHPVTRINGTMCTLQKGYFHLLPF